MTSRRLAEFIRARYDVEADDVSGLCAKCHAFERRQMKDDEDMEYEACISSNDEMSNEDEREQEKEEEEVQEEEQEEEEEEQEEEEDNHDDDMDVQEEDSSEDSLLELTHNQQEAMEMLFSVFRTLNMKTIHDQ